MQPHYKTNLTKKKIQKLAENRNLQKLESQRKELKEKLEKIDKQLTTHRKGIETNIKAQDKEANQLEGEYRKVQELLNEINDKMSKEGKR